MNPRTSVTHSLRVNELAHPAGGLIGMTLCPGKRDPHGMSGPWRRHLATDIEAIRDWGASVVVTLVQSQELELLNVEGLGEAVREQGMEWLHLPITDGGVPDDAFEVAWWDAGPRLRELLADGGRVLLHCRGGLGRTGVIAARLLVEAGVAPQEAIKNVRAARSKTIENATQERYVLGLAPAIPLVERIRGCLLAGACGDALGAAVEFMQLDEIIQRYGSGGIRDYDMAYGRLGAITDDTQMTIFTVEGLIRNWIHHAVGEGDPVENVHRSYLRWLQTQGGRNRLLSVVKTPFLDNAELWSERAPGATCIKALQQARRYGEFASNGSKGCGGVMRVAPVGFFKHWGQGLEARFKLGADLARLTHGHSSGYLAAGFLSALVAGLANGHGLEASLDRAEEILRKVPEAREVLTAVERAREFAAQGASVGHVERLGQGWVAEEALAISIYCALACENLEEAVILAVNHSGDSDSTGAITGNILGTLHGARAIPGRWLAALELKKLIEALAEDFTAIVTTADTGDIGTGVNP